MLGFVERLADIFRPPIPEGEDPEATVREYWWRMKVALGLSILASGAIVALTPVGFTRAADVDEKIAAAVAPLEQQITQVKATVDQLTMSQYRAEVRELEGKVIDATVRKCKASSEEARTYYRERALEYQRELRDLTGEIPTPLPDCTAL